MKKLIALALVLAVVSCGLVGCGGGAPAPKAPAKPATGGGEEPK